MPAWPQWSDAGIVFYRQLTKEANTVKKLITELTTMYGKPSIQQKYTGLASLIWQDPQIEIAINGKGEIILWACVQSHILQAGLCVSYDCKIAKNILV